MEKNKIDKGFAKKLEKILKSDSRFVDQEGDLLKSEVVNQAQKIDPKLIELLLGDEKIKKTFFTEIEKHWIFDINKFVDFIQLKEFLPDSYTKYRNKVGLQIDGKYMKEKGEVALVWPYKDGVLEGGQTKEEQKRDEIFFNEILAQDEIDRLFHPKVLTGWKRWVLDKKSGKAKSEKVTEIKRGEDGTIKENMIIKGNNLLALHTLKKQFAGKVKLIYIDPPYNTGNDSFGYNDKFNHSTWLTFMKNRLEVAKELLNEKGSIWINIDDSESHYLKILCDDLFGRENFIGNIIWEKSDSPRMDATFFSVRHDHILVYAKNSNLLRFNIEVDDKIPDHYNKVDKSGRTYYLKPLRVMGGNISKSLYFPMIAPDGTKIFPVEKDGKEGCWRWSKEKIKAEKERIEWVQGQNGWSPYFRIYADSRRATPLETIWKHENVGSNRTSKNELKKILGKNIFDTPKPEKLLQKIINNASFERDIVLDFFSGSGTTLAVAHKINRQYIGIEQMGYIHDLPESRLKKVIEGEQGGISKTVDWKGGGDFIYCELAEWNERFMTKIQKTKTTKELLKIWNEMKDPRISFLNWQVNVKKQDETIEDFKKLTIKEQKETLLDLLDKNQLYVNLSEITDVDYKILEEDKKLNKEFYD